MNESLQFLLKHGYTVLFLAVFAEQVGLPIPAVPLLLAMGVLVGGGQLDLVPAFLIALTASLLSDTTVWLAAFGGLGFVFSNQLERVAQRALQLGEGLVYLLAVALAGYIAYKYIQRQRFLRELRIARITPLELQHKLEAGENVLVVDLRSSTAFEAEPAKLPGALHMSPEELEQRHQEIPRDRDIVLYCT